MAGSYSPPRFWWLKRLSLGFVVVLLVVSVVHAGLWWWADRRIERERVEWLAAGGLDPAGALAGTPPPPVGEDNVAAGLVQVFAALPPLTLEQDTNWDNAEWSFPLTDPQLSAVRSIVEQDRPTVEQYRRVIQRPRVDWGFDAIELMGLLPDLNSLRNLANHLSWGVFVAQHDGDLTAALRAGHDVLALGPVSAAYGNSLVSSLVSTGISLMGTSRLRENVIGRWPNAASPEAERAAWRENRAFIQQELIPLLLDEAYDRDLVALGFRGEWVMNYTLRDDAAEWSLIGRNPLTAPFFDHQLADLLEAHACATAAASERVQFDQLTAALPATEERPTAAAMADTVTGAFFDVLLPSHDRAVLTFYRSITERRATAVLLALELYAADHEGALPGALDELVPEYLPKVPVDPFSPTGAPLGYRTDTPLPLVYSVGEDGVDQGGSVVPTGREATPTHPYGREDFVYPQRFPEAFDQDPFALLAGAGESPTTSPTTSPMTPSTTPSR